jgi:D-arabinose 1-dehydrogenase-like Zn-dependent alcohol dehydrogenase
MLVYNIICNTYILTVDTEKKEAVRKIQSYIVAEKNRKKYIKKVNIKRESDYLIDKVNNEIKCDDAKLILNTIINKFVHRTMKALDKA